MALGTMTFDEDRRAQASAPLGMLRVQFAGDTSYPTGGTTGFQQLIRDLVGREVTVLEVTKASFMGAYTPIYDVTNDTLFVETAAGAEVAPATPLNGVTFDLWVKYE